MCGAGKVTLTVRNWVNKNAATPYALSYNCLVCTNACTVAVGLTDVAAAHVGAAVDAAKLGTVNLAGTGT
jgi:hypothetical protein